MRAQFILGFVEVAFDRCVFDGSVRFLDLIVGPGMSELRQSMIDIGSGAGIFGGARPNQLSCVKVRLDVGRH